jgi:hypothetical protein
LSPTPEPLGRVEAVALRDQAELDLPAEALVDVEAVVTDVGDDEVLEVERAAPDLDAVVDVVHDLDEADVGPAADAAEGEPVQLVVEAHDSTAVADREVLDRAAVVVVVATAVQHLRVAREVGHEALHRRDVVGVRRRSPSSSSMRPRSSSACGSALARIGRAGSPLVSASMARA